jgi:aminomethyltransferase
MVPFSGWHMPVEYQGLIAEHLAVRRAAGLFDVSHMGEFEVRGQGALAYLQRVTCNDVARLADGQAQYSALPLASGAPVDDVIVYRHAADRYLLVVNAGNRDKDWRWLHEQSPEGCALVDRSDALGLLALQGPRAQAILQPLTALPLAKLAYYRFAEGPVAGVQAVVARTGYTGEDGFELFVPAEEAVTVWRALMERGAPEGLVPAGLGARDTLRLEARMCLYGNDMDESTTLVEAGLGWIVATGKEKGDFSGRAVLAAQKENGPPRKLVGFEVVGPGIARHGYPVFVDGDPSGAVTSGSYAPFLQKSIGLAYLPADRAKVGTEIEIEVRKRRIAGRVVPTPFYKRQK